MKKGLSIFKMARQSIKGWFPTSKGGKNVLIPFVSTVEETFLYYLEYNPEVIHIERADLDEDFAISNKLNVSSTVPIIIPYLHRDKKNHYYPDFLITLRGGKTVVAEVGLREDKIKERSLDKAIAALEYCESRGWEYWLAFKEDILTKAKKDNLIFLKSYDKLMYRLPEIQQKLMETFKKSKCSLRIDYLISELSFSFSQSEAEMALYELLNRAAKEGKLDFNLDGEKLLRNSYVYIMPEREKSNIPDFINISKEQILEFFTEKKTQVENELVDQKQVIEPVYIDSEQLPEELRDSFLRKRRAVTEVLLNRDNITMLEISQKYNIKRSTLYRLINKYSEYGDLALLPYSNYKDRGSCIEEEVQLIIRKILKKNSKWTSINIFESEELRKSIVNLSKEKKRIYKLPSYWQIYRLLEKIKEDLEKNSKKKTNNNNRMSVYGRWVTSISCHMDQVQVDASDMDIKIINEGRTEVSGRVCGIVLVDVRTAMILGYSLSLKAPIEEDYMMALKSCIEPKDEVVKRYNCENDWPSFGIPRKILSDNGKIFISKRSTDVIANRFNIVEEIAPPYTPSVKGTVEALFTWIKNRLNSRLPGATNNRDTKEVSKEVLKKGITFEEFEELFVRAIVDSYIQDWDDLRGQSRYNLWTTSESENGSSPKWFGSQDELKLLLMKEEKSRKVDNHGISFCGRYYNNPASLNPLLGQRVNIRYDKRDISVIYVYLIDGKYYCEVYCHELLGKRISIWEHKIAKQNERDEKRPYRLKARSNVNELVSYAQGFSKRKVKERESQFKEQVRIYDNQDIHIEKVDKMLGQGRNINQSNLDISNSVELQPIQLGNINFKKPVIRRL